MYKHIVVSLTGELQQHAGLAHSGVSYDDVLEEVLVGHAEGGGRRRRRDDEEQLYIYLLCIYV
jgi:hypothetical protein